MRLVRRKGGYSIGVFDPASGNRKKVYQLFNDDRLDFYAPARYTERSALTAFMKQIIDDIAVKERHKAAQQQLRAPAEAYKRKLALERLLSSYDDDMTPEERETLKTMLEHVENFLYDKGDRS